MRCLKCGQETENGQVFCAAWLAQMKGQPIKPGTPVNIPIRPASEPREAQRQQIRPEEQISLLEGRLSFLRKWIAALVVLVLLLSVALGYFVYQDLSRQEIGQNYQPMETVDGAGAN